MYKKKKNRMSELCNNDIDFRFILYYNRNEFCGNAGTDLHLACNRRKGLVARDGKIGITL